jgi:hypothetical protein
MIQTAVDEILQRLSPASRARHPWIALGEGAFFSAAVFALPLALYLLTAAPTLYNLDSAELTVAVATGGLMRATGYPLYLLLGKLWSLIPFGDMGYRMNLFSAFNGALTVWLAYSILRRLNVGRLPASSAVGLLAVAPFFWSLSLVAEVYTLHTALMAGLILLLLDWDRRPGLLRLGAITAWIGLSMGHHLATTLLVPGASFYILSKAPQRWLRPIPILIAAGGLLLGLSIYLYLPLRLAANPEFNYAGVFDASGLFHPVDLGSLEGLTWLITGESFESQMLAYRGSALWRETLGFLGHLARSFIYVGIGPGLLGIAILVRRDWRLGIALAAMFGFSAFFYIDYLVIDKETMFLPAYMVWAIWVGIGYQELLRRADDVQIHRGLSVVYQAAVIAGMLWTLPQVNLSQDRSTVAHGEAVLSHLGSNALLFGWWDTAPPVHYLKLVEGQRDDIQVINRFLISQADMYELAYTSVSQRPVYFDSVPEKWDQVFIAIQLGPVYRLLSPEDIHREVQPEILEYRIRPR